MVLFSDSQNMALSTHTNFQPTSEDVSSTAVEHGMNTYLVDVFRCIINQIPQSIRSILIIGSDKEFGIDTAIISFQLQEIFSIDYDIYCLQDLINETQ